MATKSSKNKTPVLTNSDLDKIGNLLDNRLAPLATKEFVRDEIKNSEHRIKGYIDEGIETVMEGVDSLSKQLAEKETVERLTKWAKLVGEKVGVRIDI